MVFVFFNSNQNYIGSNIPRMHLNHTESIINWFSQGSLASCTTVSDHEGIWIVLAFVLSEDINWGFCGLLQRKNKSKYWPFYHLHLIKDPNIKVSCDVHSGLSNKAYNSFHPKHCEAYSKAHSCMCSWFTAMWAGAFTLWGLLGLDIKSWSGTHPRWHFPLLLNSHIKLPLKWWGRFMCVGGWLGIHIGS